MAVVSAAPIASRATAWRVRSPRRVPLTVAVIGPPATGFAFFPSYLPHQPVTTGVVLALAWALGCSLARRVRGWTGPRVGRELYLTDRTRRLALLTSTLAVAAISTGALAVQNAMREHIGMAPLTSLDLVALATAAIATVGMLRALARVWQHRARWWRPAAALVIAGMLSGATLPASSEGTGAASVQEQVLRQPATHGAIRAYASLADAADVDRRARVAATRLVRSGGLSREHVVLVLPTGSGWVNPHLVTGLEQRFGREVATVAMQYDNRPSWLAYLLGRDDAEIAAGAVFDAITGALQRVPATERPQLHVVGESLGALAGQALFDRTGHGAARAEVCGVMWVGTPGGDGVGAPQEVLVGHDDDPVVHADPSMLIAPPDDGRPWLPVVSGVQAFTDFLGSLAVPTGSGHRYGPAQADRLQTCGSTQGPTR